MESPVLIINLLSCDHNNVRKMFFDIRKGCERKSPVISIWITIIWSRVRDLGYIILSWLESIEIQQMVRCHCVEHLVRVYNSWELTVECPDKVFIVIWKCWCFHDYTHWANWVNSFSSVPNCLNDVLKVQVSHAQGYA